MAKEEREIDDPNIKNVINNKMEWDLMLFTFFCDTDYHELIGMLEEWINF